ncbi:thioredoxin domain-containing protein [Sphingomonas sp. ID0503]|uniref:thioredoxin domain-containing protein n=1 Tax=Sphingomonas sp. ID0503 TaxID=3399691 RepID=UPI003AFB30F4
MVIAGFVLPPILITRWMEPEPVARPLAGRIAGDLQAPALGPTDAAVTIVMFTDHRCPVCRRTEAVIEKGMVKGTGVRFILKDWAILGDDSVLAARAALAAQYQGKYWPMHRALMRSTGTLDQGRIATIAAGAGVDPIRLVHDMRANAEAIEARLAQISREALDLRLPGTPGILVGPFLVKGGVDSGQLRKLIEEAREEAEGNS